MKYLARVLPLAPKPSSRMPTCPRCFMVVTSAHVFLPTLRSRMKSFWFFNIRIPKVFMRLHPCQHELFGNDIGTYSSRVLGINVNEMVDRVDEELSAPKAMFEADS